MEAGAHCAARCGIDRISHGRAERSQLLPAAPAESGCLPRLNSPRDGYRVVATMRDLGRSGRLEEAAQKAGVRDRLDLRRLDVTEFDTLPGAVEQIVRDHGRIDVLVNNAGFSVAGFVEDLSLDEIRHPVRDQLLRRGRACRRRCCRPCGGRSPGTSSR